MSKCAENLNIHDETPGGEDTGLRTAGCRTQSPVSSYIYEIKDVTNDEMFYSLGIYTTLGEAVEWLTSFKDNPPSDGAEEYCIIEIHRRKLGGDFKEKVEARFQYSEVPNPEGSAMGYRWEMTKALYS